METPALVRVDKWLWAVRQYKTRTLATTACEQGKIIIQGQAVKPSRHIKIGEEIKLKRTGLIKTLKVLQLTVNRLNAKLVPEYAEDLTPPEEIEAYKSRASRVTIFRDPGTGRPTKRERRDLDEFMGEY
ncbi:MAG TPA: RNA-binding S4 domain-containing protein [Bacteroidia bacterium]|nr:RNA-binding S4 domain-containing protein [Bacteroidia bacterium]